MIFSIYEIHLKAPEYLINDSDGFAYYQRQCHIFYQYFPYGVQWGRTNWEYVVSDGTVFWKYLGIVLFPSIYANKCCFIAWRRIHD